MMSRKRARTSSDSAIVDVWKRELGQFSSRNFTNRLAASEDLVLRFDILRKLDRHRGCVNTVYFNASGDVLISGSDDRKIILWDWESGQAKLSFHSGHTDNVFQAKMMHYSEDRSIVTCAADGQVRHAQILDSGVETKLLARHAGRVHKLAIEPGSPHIFYTCGEDGKVKHIDLRTGSATSLFTCMPLQSHSLFLTMRLKTITINPRNPNLFAVGGSDAFARVYDIRKYKCNGSSEFGSPVDLFCPIHLVGEGSVGITGLSFSDQSELLASYNHEFIYLFTKDLGLGPNPTLSSQESDTGGLSVESDTKAAPQSYGGHMNFETVKGVNFFGPKCEYVVSGSDCGRIFIWNKKGGELVRVMKADKHVVNCVQPHPHATVLASSGIEHDIKMWIPKAIDKAILPTNIQKDQVPNLMHRTFSYFGGLYDDDDDDEFICSDDDDEDDDDDEGGDDTDDIDNESTDDRDDSDDDGGGGHCDTNDHVTASHEHARNEVQNEQMEEEEDGEGDNSTDLILVGGLVEHESFGSQTSIHNEIENISGSESDGDLRSDDLFLDISDTDDFSISVADSSYIVLTIQDD